jgi:Flp pilus assembly protein TadG
MRRFTDLLKRFRRDESGAFLVLFAVIALVLIATSGAVVDFTYLQTARSRAQNALDAAALALQSKVAEVNAGKTTKALAEADIKSKADQIVRERLADATITSSVTSATINTSLDRLDLSATITVPTAFVQLVGIHNITAQLNSRAIRGSTDLEVSAVLDVTGSMAPCDRWGNCDYTKINALKTATTNLITNLVSTTQTPTYSKMAIVPFSYGVNVGTYADKIRGTITTKTANLTSSDWGAANGTSISSISVVNNGTITITSSSHGLATNDWVYITGMSGSGWNRSAVTNLNDQAYQVTKKDSSNFTLKSVTGSATTTGSGGTVYKCKYANCDVHLKGTFNTTDFKAGDGVYVTGVSTLTNINNTGYFVTSVTSTDMYIKALAAGGQYKSGTGGKITRANYGDVYYHFNTAAGGENTFSSSTCVTERSGSDAYTDAAPPSGTFTAASRKATALSPMYPSSSSNCVSQAIVPLTSDRTTLNNAVTNLSAAGSTSGHLGLAWGWYMLAPNFGYLWPTTPIDSRPAAYKRSNLTKALIMMTDGEFNTDYYNGVIAQDSTSDSSSNMINQNGPNGSSTSQATSLCTAIKNVNNGILLYTVGFEIGSNSTADVNARALLSACATDTSYFYQADSASDLDDAFKQIAQKLNALRIAQ